MVYAASADEKTRALELLIDSAGEEPMWIVECCRRIAHFGNILRLHEESHDVRGWLDRAIQDMRHAGVDGEPARPDSRSEGRRTAGVGGSRTGAVPLGPGWGPGRRLLCAARCRWLEWGAVSSVCSLWIQVSPSTALRSSIRRSRAMASLATRHARTGRRSFKRSHRILMSSRPRSHSQRRWEARSTHRDTARIQARYRSR
jgi:hypothetical protein